MRPYALELLEAFGADRCIWGSDWPFMNPDYGPAKRPAPVAAVEYSHEFGALSNWVSDEQVRRKILWANPARLFGFSETATLNDVKATS
jgi:predicted TIM-barrel fold metal-dependent hydrolase